MEIINIDGNLLKEIFTGAVNYLIANKDEINALNVFPVPDGDTGTNMSLTAKSALKQINNLTDTSSLYDVAKEASRGALMGARGNSGVILSQLLRGFAEGLEGKDFANLNEIAHAFKKASETTYKAVMKPIEGTILTVGRETADYALRVYKKHNNFKTFLEDILVEANKSLKNTKEILDVLKEADVVDAGGKGLVTILEGALKVISGETIESVEDDEVLKKKAQKEIVFGDEDDSIEFGYCTEFIINTNYEDIEAFRAKLAPLGDSLLVVGGEGTGLIKVHVHTNHPGKALEYAVELGGLQDIKIDNMRYQHREILFEKSEVERAKKEEQKIEEDMEEKDNSFIVVSMGEGMSELFKSLGVDYIVNGGQTMNPSTEDLLKGIDKVKGKRVYIIPNNSNIILAAEQARDISNRDVVVIPSKSVPQGVAAILAFNSEKSKEENIDAMIESLNTVTDAQITYAVRDTTINNKNVKKGDIIGLSSKELVSCGDSIEKVLLETIDHLIDDEKSIITLYYGEDVKEDDAEKIYEKLEETYPNMDIDLINGKQPIYYYIVSLD